MMRPIDTAMFKVDRGKFLAEKSLLTFVRALMMLACGPLVVPPTACACHGSDVVDCHDDHESPPPCNDDHHSPGCPALWCADRVPVVAPTVYVMTYDSASAVVLYRLDQTTSTDRSNVPSVSAHPSDPPLFLSHCALVR